MNRKWIGLAVILLAAAALVVVGVLHFRHERMFPATDDAYVNGDRTAVASRVPGVLLSGSPEEGPLLGNVKPAPAPPGRGRLVTRDRGVDVVQVDVDVVAQCDAMVVDDEPLRAGGVQHP